MTKAKLTKLSDNKNALRTNTVEGVFFEAPGLNKSFKIIGEALEDGDCRLVYTSKIQNIEMKDENILILTTLNSIYQLEILK